MNAENPAGNAPQVADMVRAICTAHPDTQAIYLYGSWDTEHQRQDSDLAKHHGTGTTHQVERIRQRDCFYNGED